MAGVTRDRGISPTVNLVLVAGISVLLVSGLLVGISGVFDQQRDRAVREGLAVTGERLAADLLAADRAAATVTDGHVVVHSRVPTRVSGAQYTVDVQASADGVTLVLRAPSLGVSVQTSVANRTAVSTGTYTGGPLRFEFRGDRIEVEDG